MGFIKRHPYLFWQLTGLFILVIDFLYMWFNLDNEQISYAFIVLMGMVAFAVIILSPFVIKSRKRLKDIGEIAALHRYNYMEEWYAQTYMALQTVEEPCEACLLQSAGRTAKSRCSCASAVHGRTHMADAIHN